MRRPFGKAFFWGEQTRQVFLWFLLSCTCSHPTPGWGGSGDEASWRNHTEEFNWRIPSHPTCSRICTVWRHLNVLVFFFFTYWYISHLKIGLSQLRDNMEGYRNEHCILQKSWAHLPKRKVRRQQVHAGAVMHSSALGQHHGKLFHPRHLHHEKNSLDSIGLGLKWVLSMSPQPWAGREVQKGYPGCSSSFSASTWYKDQKLLLGHFCHSREIPQSAAWPCKGPACHEVKTLNSGVTRDVVTAKRLLMGPFPAHTLSFCPHCLPVKPSLPSSKSPGHSAWSSGDPCTGNKFLWGCLKLPLFPVLSISSLSHSWAKIGRKRRQCKVKGSGRGHKHEPGDNRNQHPAQCLYGEVAELAALHQTLLSAAGHIARTWSGQTHLSSSEPCLCLSWCERNTPSAGCAGGMDFICFSWAAVLSISQHAEMWCWHGSHQQGFVS